MKDSQWTFAVEIPPDETVMLLGSDLVENAFRIAELGSSVMAVAPGFAAHLSVGELVEKYHVSNELRRKIQLCVSGGLKEMPFREKSFGLIAVINVEDVLEGFGYERSSWAGAEEIVSDLWRFVKPRGRMLICLGKLSLKSVLKTKRIGVPLGWIVRGLRKDHIQVESVMDYYPGLGNVMIVRDNVDKASTLRKISSGSKALLTSESVGIVCRKSNEGRNDTIAKAILVRLGEKRDYDEPGVYKIVKGSGGTFILHTGSSIVRMPRLWHPEVVDRWSTNFEALCFLRKFRLPFKTPDPIYIGQVGRQVYSVESKLSGVINERKLNSKTFENLAKQVVEKLSSLFQQTCVITFLNDEQFKRLFEIPLDRLLRFCDESEKRKLEAIKGRFREAFMYSEFPLVVTHGDFKRSNFIFGEENRLSGIFDWDLSRSSGLPLLDLYLFLGSEESNRWNRNLHVSAITEFIEKSPLENWLVSQYLERTYWIDEFRAKSLAFLLIAYYFAYHLMLAPESILRENTKALLSEGTSFFER